MANLPMSQGDLFLMLPLAWQHYTAQQPTFAAYKQSYTAELAAEALDRLRTAGELPDEQARDAEGERLRGELVEQTDEVLDLWNRLDGYIEDAFPGKVAYKAMRDAAGHPHYEAAARHDWAQLEQLMKAATNVVATEKQALRTRGEMPGNFAEVLAAEVEDVRTLTRRFLATKATAQQGTSTQETALRACLAEFQKMSGDAARVFRRQPEVGRLFQQEYLLGLVRGTGQAGLRGTLTLADGTPAPGVAVAVLGTQAPTATVSDAAGRYALAVPMGDYVVAFGGPGYAPQEQPVTVEAGVKKRLDAVMAVG